MSGRRGVSRIPWTTVVPVIGILVLIPTWPTKPGTPVLVLVALVLAAAVPAAVHHAEVISHRVGEPFGALVLAVAVTVIEVGLIVTLMVSGKGQTATLARDTVFAAVMLTVNGIAGLALLAATLRRREAMFSAEGSATALGTVLTLATLSLVVPTFTTSTPARDFSPEQLAFAATASLVLYLVFVWVQTVRHRDDFVQPVAIKSKAADAPDAGHDAGDPPWVSFVLLVVALVAVVGLAKVESPAIEDAVDAIHAPQSFVGVVIAILVLAPESIAAIRNARRGQVQTSLNLAYGSAMASIGLTIPAIAIASIWLDGPLVLGLGPTQMVLLGLTAVVAALTVLPGRATVQQAAVHLVIAAAFVFLAIRP
jgi:Ca2+:H+ antiporter